MATLGEYRTHIGVRPAIIISDSHKMYAEELDNISYFENGLMEVEYGNYPKSAAPLSMQYELSELLESGDLTLTGNHYTDILGNELPEYEFAGNRYICGKMHCFYSSINLSNGEVYYDNQNVWVQVEPLKWLLDEKSKIMITKDLISSVPKYFDLNTFLEELKQDSKIKLNSEFDIEKTNIKTIKVKPNTTETSFEIDDLKKQKINLQKQINDMQKQIDDAKRLLEMYEEIQNSKENR